MSSLFNRNLIYSIVASNVCLSLLIGSSALAENKIRGEIVGDQMSSKNPQDVDFGPYMANLQRRIKGEWFPPKREESKHVVVTFKINEKGKLSVLRIADSSGSSDNDQAALKAVRKAAPFDPLPKGEKSVDVKFIFDYNIISKDGTFKRF